MLSSQEQKFLLETARKTLELYINHRTIYKIEDVSLLTENLKAPRACFVTYRIEKELRGCIGSIYPEQALFEAVIDKAIASAVKDPRFPPVSKKEVPLIHIEISVLSPITPIASLEEYDVENHGIILQKRGCSALFLPQVATEQGWTKEDTLLHLCRKARLPEDAWRSGCQFQIFTAQVFEEES
ncbi:MAG: AmmeMemoRadiSam system protein A [Candidatus Brocadiae bacterium]|nr:AmmeMemoRadiSam system protein A [Candidatus Brocadiia bacterium]